MFEKRTRKIEFTHNWLPIQKYRFLPDYIEVNPNYLYSEVYDFCMSNKIKLKKIKTYGALSDRVSYVKIYGTKEDQIKVFKFLSANFDKYLSMQDITF